LWEYLFGPAPPPSSVNPERHWKREQDAYLTEIGAMDLINRNHTAKLGYLARQHPEYLTLNMGGSPENPNAYGEYSHRQQGEVPPGTTKRSGYQDVAVDQAPMNYGTTVAHELGHVGSRTASTEKMAA